VGFRRRFGVARADLAQVRSVGQNYGGTVNDVVLVAVGGALNSLLAHRGERIDDIVVSVPISGRTEANIVQLGAVVVGVVIGGLMVYSSKVGKIGVRDRLRDRLALVGDEDVLDLGCGSGLLLLGAAQRLPGGAATGVDLWRSRDQAGSNRALCLDNARRLGVQDRVTLIDVDITELPIPDASFDLVLACLAIHNLHPALRREQAVVESLRVLRPGGRFAFVDIAGTKSYRTVAGAAGCRDVRRLGFVLGIFPLAVVAPGPAVVGPVPPREAAFAFDVRAEGAAAVAIGVRAAGLVEALAVVGTGREAAAPEGCTATMAATTPHGGHSDSDRESLDDGRCVGVHVDLGGHQAPIIPSGSGRPKRNSPLRTVPLTWPFHISLGVARA
jgi:SAM-dependent methyltransferase